MVHCTRHALTSVTVGWWMQTSAEGNKQEAAEACLQALENEAAHLGVKYPTAVVALLSWD